MYVPTCGRVRTLKNTCGPHPTSQSQISFGAFRNPIEGYKSKMCSFGRYFTYTVGISIVLCGKILPPLPPDPNPPQSSSIFISEQSWQSPNASCSYIGGPFSITAWTLTLSSGSMESLPSQLSGYPSETALPMQPLIVWINNQR